MYFQSSPEPSLPELPLLHFRYIETIVRGRTYKKKQYYCQLCPFQSTKKQNASVHERVKKHNQLHQENQQVNIPRPAQEQPLPSFDVPLEWDPSKQNITSLFKSLIQPLLQQNVGVKDFTALAKQILLPIQVPLINNLRAALASALESVSLQNEQYQIHPNQLRLSILQLASAVDFKKLVISFEVKLQEGHTKIQQGISKQDRTYRNNQLCFGKIKTGSEIIFRNRVKCEEFFMDLSKFQRKDCLRYWNLLKKKESYFLQFPSLPILSERKIERARIIPKTMSEVKLKIEAIMHHNPTLAADMLIVIGLGLRRTDLHKVQLWDEEGNPVKFLRLVQNKNKNLTERYVPSSILRVAKSVGLSLPMSAARIKNAVKACLTSFKTCYGFRHRVLSNTIGALMGSASFLNFHRRHSTTMKYYIQTEDESLLERALSSGIEVRLPEAENRRIENRNLILDATQYPAVKFVAINQLSSITLPTNEETEERALSTIADQLMTVQQDELSEYKVHAGEIQFVAEASTANITDEPDFSSIRSAIGSITSPDLYLQVQEDAIANLQVSSTTSQNEAYAHSLAKIANVNILYAEFEPDKIKPAYEILIESGQNQEEQVVITAVEGPMQKLHIINDTSQPRMQLRRRVQRPSQEMEQQRKIMYKRQPLCTACKYRGEVSFLLAEDELIKCSSCQYTHFYELEERSQDVKFISTGPTFNQKVCVPKPRSRPNNIKEHLKEKFSTSCKFSRKLPRVIQCNFFNFQDIRQEIHSFYNKIQYMPLEIKESGIAGAGLGLYTNEDLAVGSIVGAYIGYVCHSFEVDSASDSIFQIGWYSEKQVSYLVLSDGNVVNEGSRFINSNRPKLCNCRAFLGVLGGTPVNLIISSRVIKKGEELFFNYGSLYHFGKELQTPQVNQ